MSLNVLLPSRLRKVVIAVSGGPDSMALLHRLCEISAENSPAPFQIVIGHFNHRLRPASDSETAFVMDYAASRNVPCYAASTILTPGDANIEGWARSERYSFLRSVCHQVAADWIFTAHTADDALETYLMKLLSHKECSGLMQHDPRRAVWRPLLSVSRAQIEAYNSTHAVPSVFDESNMDESRLRNRIRRKVIPFLKNQFSDNVAEHIQKTFTDIDDDISVLRELARLHVPSLEFGSPEWLKAVKKNLGDLPDGLRWRVVEEALLPQVHFRVGRRHGRRLVTFFLSNASETEFPQWRIYRRQGGILLGKGRNA